LGDPLIALAAVILELAAGYPGVLYVRIGHPVSWIGAFLQVLDAKLNRADRGSGANRAAGLLALSLLLLPVGLVAFGLQLALPHSLLGGILRCLAVAVLIAPRNLRDHVRAVRDGLESEGLEAGRKAVSRIVGRTSDLLDESGVSRAAIESLAENFSDGVVAPLLWYLAAGLPGIAFYKTINTADSMIGHRNPRYEAFGWASARLDDLVNLPASRLTALLIAAAAWPGGFAHAKRAVTTALRDAPRHRSPNPGWPEAAMAGALGLSLGGPRAYEGYVVDGAWLGDGSADASPHDIGRALALYDRALAGILSTLAAAALVSL
jgi:adenosylcobinamide-phosphate synthase